MKQQTYDFSQTMGDLDAGVFLKKVSEAIQGTAIGTVAHGDKGKKGKVVLEFTFSRLGESNQVTLTHRLKYERPTKRGKAMEEDTTETVLYVSPRTGLSIMPDNQLDFVNANQEEA